MSEGPVCAAKPELCGTLSGYQSGGRCYRCRRSNAEKGAAERGKRLTREQRDAVIAIINGGWSFDAAVAEVGVTTQAVMAAALIDSELHCALEGAPISVQRAARVGDFFAALCRSVGSEEDAHADTGISPGELLHLFHEDERLEEAKRLLSLYLRDIVEAEARQYTHISDLLVDRAIELLEGGASIQEARERLGISEAGIYRKAERHPELAAAMECAADRYRRRGFDAVLFDEIAAMIEGGMSIVAAARRAGVSSKTLRKYRSEHPVLDQAMTVAAARHGR